MLLYPDKSTFPCSLKQSGEDFTLPRNRRFSLDCVATPQHATDARMCFPFYLHVFPIRAAAARLMSLHHAAALMRLRKVHFVNLQWKRDGGDGQMEYLAPPRGLMEFPAEG